MRDGCGGGGYRGNKRGWEESITNEMRGEESWGEARRSEMESRGREQRRWVEKTDYLLNPEEPQNATNLKRGLGFRV